jgi:hypothetical protein
VIRAGILIHLGVISSRITPASLSYSLKTGLLAIEIRPGALAFQALADVFTLPNFEIALMAALIG